MTDPKVSIQLVVHNGAHYLKRCLDAAVRQSYPNCEVLVLDNASTDATREIVAQYPQARYIASPTNVGMWPGQELLLSHSYGVYVLVLSVDVVLDEQFVQTAVEVCQHDPTIAAVQGKIYQEGSDHIIDTCGFALTHARRVVNVGHGEGDGPAYMHERDIFGVEGAVPFFRRSALEDCRIEGHIVDPDFFWYGDDLDLAWRMTLFGHRQRFVPRAIAWHDRSTTKGSAQTPVLGQLKRRHLRAAIPLKKRRLDWLNVRCTIVKNDAIINLLRDAPLILARELAVAGYTLLFEPKVLTAWAELVRRLPTMLRRRRLVQARARVHPSAIHRFFV